jgi:S1-C subfamily serine protease
MDQSNDKSVTELRLGVPWGDPRPPAKPDATTQKLVDLQRSGVVTIIVGGTQGSFDYGTGFFIDREGNIGSDAHVVLPAAMLHPKSLVSSGPAILPELTVITDAGEVFPARIAKLDLDHDVAEIKIDRGTPSNAKALQMGDDNSRSPSDKHRWALGHPQTPQTLGPQPLYVSQGEYEQNVPSVNVDGKQYKKNLGRDACVDEALARFTAQPDNHLYSEAILEQSRMHTEKGYSGGPVFDSQGRVIRIVDRVGTTPDTTYSTSISYLRKLVNEPSAYSFSYQPDPNRPGYQILTGIERIDGKPVKAIFPPAYYFVVEACRPKRL